MIQPANPIEKFPVSAETVRPIEATPFSGVEQTAGPAFNTRLETAKVPEARPVSLEEKRAQKIRVLGKAVEYLRKGYSNAA